MCPPGTNPVYATGRQRNRSIRSGSATTEITLNIDAGAFDQVASHTGQQGQDLPILILRREGRLDPLPASTILRSSRSWHAGRSSVCCGRRSVVGRRPRSRNPVPAGISAGRERIRPASGLALCGRPHRERAKLAQRRAVFVPWPWALNIDGEGALFSVTPAGVACPRRRR
jgi:hypothetical protein